ncbi:MAG TPA: undecaprenyl-diphosphate phosphatase [candidate division Zixibacteria bacterium]|nr:undecaprenyl-diphosphate phosphatase [candidate division Zixibacteria bacterium]
MVAVWLIIVLAIVQGILEWLPVSSEGWLVLILNWVGETENALAIALFLHLGTMIAVIIRFRKDFALLFKIQRRKMDSRIEDNKEEDESINIEEKKEDFSQIEKQKILWKFILFATLATAVIGVPLYLLIKFALQDGELLEFAGGAITGGDIITMVIGLFLIGTGIFILIARKKTTYKTIFEMKTWEMLIVGAIQGIAIIPGVSRSGSTIGTLLIEGIEEEEALRGSFLLSVPAVLGGNILTLIVDLAQGDFSFEGIPWYGMILAFIVSCGIGYLTIDLFLRLARKINFGWFCIAVGSLALVITLIVVILAITTIV